MVRKFSCSVNYCLRQRKHRKLWICPFPHYLNALSAKFEYGWRHIDRSFHHRPAWCGRNSVFDAQQLCEKRKDDSTTGKKRFARGLRCECLFESATTDRTWGRIWIWFARKAHNGRPARCGFIKLCHDILQA